MWKNEETHPHSLNTAVSLHLIQRGAFLGHREWQKQIENKAFYRYDTQ